MLQAWSEKPRSFLRPLKKKGFKEARVATMGLYDLGKAHDPGIQQEPAVISKPIIQPHALGKRAYDFLARSRTSCGSHRTIAEAEFQLYNAGWIEMCG
jgi:hypothetical protein